MAFGAGRMKRSARKADRSLTGPERRGIGHRDRSPSLPTNVSPRNRNTARPKRWKSITFPILSIRPAMNTSTFHDLFHVLHLPNITTFWMANLYVPRFHRFHRRQVYTIARHRVRNPKPEIRTSRGWIISQSRCHTLVSCRSDSHVDGYSVL